MRIGFKSGRYETTEPIIHSQKDHMPIFPADMSEIWWVEPCAGSGNILRQMPTQRRLGWDINPQDNGEFGIIQADFREQLLDSSLKWVVLANPAFGKQPGDKLGGPQTLFAWAARQRCVVAIGIITPHWFQSPRIENKLDAYFHRTHIEVLPPESFTHKGQVKWSPAIFTFWVRRDYMRDQIVVRDTHPDWEWLPAQRNLEADAWMQMWGVGVGDIKAPDNLGKINDWSLHAYIKEIRPGTIERLKRINWREVTYLTLSAPRLHKDEIVGAYIAAYGNPEALDYDPGREDAGEHAVAPESPPTSPSAPREASVADSEKHPGRRLDSAASGHR
jgi:hypothetical protein